MGNKKLIFRLGGIGFFVDLFFVAEVVDPIAGLLDPRRSDIGQGIIAALQFRKTWIPLVDPALKLGLNPQEKVAERAAIVLRGPEGNWAIVVDQVAELSSDDELKLCDIPFLLKVTAMNFYTKIFLIKDEPFVVFEPERYYRSFASPA